MPHRRPGWTAPTGHLVRSHAEAALCTDLVSMTIAHTHWEGAFDLPIGTAQLRLYVPAMTLSELRAAGKTVIIEPIDSAAPGSGLRRLQTLRQVHGDAYCVLVVARRPLHHRLPPEAYDHLFPLETFTPLRQFLRGLA